MRFLRRFVFATIALVIWSNAAVAGTVTFSATASAPQKLRWKTNSIHISVSQSLARSAPNIKSDSDIAGALRRSLEAWQSVANIDFEQDISEKLNVSPAGVSGDGVSLVTIAATPENVLLFGKGEEATAAKTRIFYNRRGFITEADIVLSPYQQFSTDGTYGTFDLEETLTHEIGHLLGLRHSLVVGAIMYDVSARNGVFGDNGLVADRISDDDASAIRDLYGPAADEDCCGVVVGHIAGIGNNARDMSVWLQDTESGRVIGHGTVTRDGSFRVGGLESGTYDVGLRENGRAGNLSDSLLGRVTVESGDSVAFSRKDVRENRDFSLQFLGKNIILSDSALELRRGSTYTLYVGGTNLSPERTRIEVGSRKFKVDQGKLTAQAYDNGMSGISVAVSVDANTPVGNYNVCAVSESGARDCIVGGITIVD